MYYKILSYIYPFGVNYYYGNMSVLVNKMAREDCIHGFKWLLGLLIILILSLTIWIITDHWHIEKYALVGIIYSILFFFIVILENASIVQLYKEGDYRGNHDEAKKRIEKIISQKRSY